MRRTSTSEVAETLRRSAYALRLRAHLRGFAASGAPARRSGATASPSGGSDQHGRRKAPVESELAEGERRLADTVGFDAARPRPKADGRATESTLDGTTRPKVEEWRREWDSNPR